MGERTKNMVGRPDRILGEALSAAAAIGGRQLAATDLADLYLERIAELEPRVHAWAYLDPDSVRTQAAKADAALSQIRRPGPLYGIPIGIKDIVDTADMPTENGTVLDRHRQPEQDATVVSLLRSAGAIIMGKTVTTEMATYAPGPTTNPHDPLYSPGGSSSGSAAAVAAGMVPLAIGTQTNGSVIRPAAYCGVVGFKPTRGCISRTGVLVQSETLDQIGVFARTVPDAALLAQQIMARDPAQGDTEPAAHPDLLAEMDASSRVPPRIAFARSPVWEEAEPYYRDAILGFARTLPGGIDEIEVPSPSERATAFHKAISGYEICRNYRSYYDRGKEHLSPQLREMIETGLEVSDETYAEAQAGAEELGRHFSRIFAEYDVLLTPAATGEAPNGLDTTGSPIFCTLWTLCGLPCITLPLMTGPSGMPLGVQLVGGFGQDGRLLGAARQIMESRA